MSWSKPYQCAFGEFVCNIIIQWTSYMVTVSRQKHVSGPDCTTWNLMCFQFGLRYTESGWFPGIPGNCSHTTKEQNTVGVINGRVKLCDEKKNHCIFVYITMNWKQKLSVVCVCGRAYAHPCVSAWDCTSHEVGVGVAMATALCVCTDEREGPHVQLIKGREKGRVNFFLTVSNRSHDCTSADTGNKISAVQCVFVCMWEREGREILEEREE